MQLREYLRISRLTASGFGERVGASEAAVGKWVRGERIPRREMMARIERATDGAVTPADFYAAEQEQPQEQAA